MYALSQFVPLLNLWCRTNVRGKIREQKSIEGTCLKDLLCVWCCPICSLVQEARVRMSIESLKIDLQLAKRAELVCGADGVSSVVTDANVNLKPTVLSMWHFLL